MIYLLEWAARLVLALGAEAKIDAVPGSAEYALPFTTLEHALVRINHMMKLFEVQLFTMDYLVLLI